MSEKLQIKIIELPPYLDVAGIVKNFAIGKDTIWEAIHAGELTAIKPGRIFKKPGQPDVVKRGKKYIIPTAEVVAWYARWIVPFKTKGERHEDRTRSMPRSSSLNLV